MTDRERLDSLCAALRLPSGEIFSLPRPARHGALFQELWKRDGANRLGVRREQGFVDGNGTFLTRVEGFKLARACGAVEESELESPPLFTEDLW